MVDFAAPQVAAAYPVPEFMNNEAAGVFDSPEAQLAAAQAAPLTEPPKEEPNPYAGMNFLEVFEKLVGAAPSSDVGLASFKATLQAIEHVHKYFGIEFKAEEYWGPDKIKGSWPVWPDAIKPLPVPAEITVEDIQKFAELQDELAKLEVELRRIADQAVRARQHNGNTGHIENRRLEQAIQRAALYVPVSTNDEEDDFL